MKTAPRQVKDITEKTFGLLTAIRFSDAKNGNARWVFECSCCKKTKVLFMSDVSRKKPRTTGCGFYPESRRTDLTGRVFGHLIVIKYLETNKHGRAVFLVKCQCGNSKPIVGAELTMRRHPTNSCGCQRGKANLKSLVGQKFGYLVVKKIFEIHPKNGALYQCFCTACNQLSNKRYIGRDLRKTKSCGCISKKLAVKTQLKRGVYLHGHERSFRRIYNRYKYRARREKKVTFNLSRERFKRLIVSNCAYCGCLPSQNSKSKRKLLDSHIMKYNGIDRVNNQYGYTPENTVPCCGTCNNIKVDLTLNELKRFVEVILDIRKKRRGLSRLAIIRDSVPAPPPFLKDSFDKFERCSPYVAAFKNCYFSYAREAKAKRVVFSLSPEEFYSLTNSECAYCNLKPKQISRHNLATRSTKDVYLYNGIDRMDDEKGYEVRNCIPCCMRCNNKKRTLSIAQMKRFITVMLLKKHSANRRYRVQ